MIENLIEIKFGEEEDFLKIKETLTRIGVASSNEKKTLYQSCHILHKQGKYYLVHFKELFLLDGKSSNFSEEDRARRNRIASLLEDWNLVRIVNKEQVKNNMAPMSLIKVIPFKEKGEWTLQTKYNIGKKKK